MSESKIKPTTAIFTANENLFRCPLCSASMEFKFPGSLVCANGHCFDMAKQGYVNFLARPPQSKYDRQMFAARRTMYSSGFFAPLTQKITEAALSAFHPGDRAVILDAGCGEGSLLARMWSTMTADVDSDFLGVGIDIAKDGILMAARDFKNQIWCVGDLANAPFAAGHFALIINILAPANYSEFKRMLAPGGRLVKVIPERGYLKELREILQQQKPGGPNDDTLALFKKNFELVSAEQVRYCRALEEAWIKSLLQMTPLSWNAAAEHRAKALESVKAVTVDLSILVGKPRRTQIAGGLHSLDGSTIST